MLVSFFTSLWLFEDSFTRLGLFVLGCSPGGTNSNFYNLLLRGDVNLSITMTTISTIAALGMMPLWMWMLARHLTPKGEYTIQIPYSQLALSLFLLTVPLACGLLIKLKRPKWAAISNRIIRPFTFLILIFNLTARIIPLFAPSKSFLKSGILPSFGRKSNVNTTLLGY
ncbi:unnamed protein product [Darwinula stevensoni]|uniref:Uncharacterized protein n=1 Tax=Darwinula stevensoni TaxID=69355 RepID=A0A7R9A9C9_9CRUS|nr:unnamed protein product [Darwinula stevensoni]CAG0897277.1 unnamed protein product [Darwinula stevensoni]